MGKIIDINNNNIVLKREKAKLYTQNIQNIKELFLIIQAIECGLITDIDIVFKYKNEYFCYNKNKSISKEKFIYDLLLKLKQTKGKVIIK